MNIKNIKTAITLSLMLLASANIYTMMRYPMARQPNVQGARGEFYSRVEKDKNGNEMEVYGGPFQSNGTTNIVSVGYVPSQKRYVILSQWPPFTDRPAEEIFQQLKAQFSIAPTNPARSFWGAEKAYPLEQPKLNH